MLNLDTHIRLDGSIPAAANLTSRFTDDDLARIGSWVWEGYTKDASSRGDWLRRTQAAMNLALQLQEDKSFPWPNCSNIAFPLITIAAMQFHARAYPSLISGTQIVKFRVPSPDPKGESTDRALRVGQYMSYQVLEEDQAWEEQHDRLLLQIPIVGCSFVKTWRSPAKGHNVSEVTSAIDLVIDYYAKSVESAGRKTQVLQLSRNDVHEKCMAGTWRDITEESWYQSPTTPQRTPAQEEADARKGIHPPTADYASDMTFLECHCWADFDQDGYQEPYIITIDGNNQQVTRIVARWEQPADVERNGRGQVVRIRATEWYTKYGLIPSPDGSIYDMGFGVLLGPLNESVNSLVNMLTDAGTMSVASGGFLSRGVKIRGGEYSFSPFQWNRVDSTGDDLKKGIVELPVREPSQVLFTLLTFLVNYVQRISGATDAVSGENPGQNTPAQTQQSMVEQGQMIYSALFKRVWRCMKEEFRKLYILNARHLPTSQPFGQGGMIAREDFLGNPDQIVPVADPHVESDQMRLQKAAAIAERARSVPGYDVIRAEKDLLRAMRVDGVDALFPGPDKVPPLPNPKAALEEVKARGKMELDKQKGEREAQQHLLDLLAEQGLNEAQITLMEAQTALAAAQADSEGKGKQIAMFDAMIGAAKARNEHIRGQVDQMIAGMELALKSQELDQKKKELANAPSK